MRWRKQGRVWGPDGTAWWARSHAYVPTPWQSPEGHLRVFCTTLDDASRGRPIFIDLDPDSLAVVRVAPGPLLDLGPPGHFDEAGVNPSSAFELNGRPVLSYVGWQRARDVPYACFAGLARVDGTVLTRLSSEPILPPTAEEPHIRSATTIVQEDHAYRMWYVGASGWLEWRGKRVPRYTVRQATSATGHDWSVLPEHAIVPADEREFGFGRPWVVRDPDRYRMWYSIRATDRPYRIGYAESTDGYTWTRRDDEVGITASDEGWDSEMICYPAVIDVDGRRLMFYNGNQHGETGFGCAILEDF